MSTADFASLVDSVIEITKRGERKKQIQLAIAKATLKFHLVDFWQRDLIEKDVVVDDSDKPIYHIDVGDKMKGFRKLAYMNAWDPTGRAVLFEFTEISPMRPRTDYGYLKQEGYYLAGGILNIRSVRNFTHVLAGWYTTPSVNLNEYDSWVAKMYSPAIIDEACAEIFGSIGDNDEAARRGKMFPENLRLIRINEIEATAR